jgi:hypothetical protein
VSNDYSKYIPTVYLDDPLMKVNRNGEVTTFEMREMANTLVILSRSRTDRRETTPETAATPAARVEELTSLRCQMLQDPMRMAL